MTSWQSGETPCGRSAGDMSVTRPPKISIGASNEPAVVIFVVIRLGCASQTCRVMRLGGEKSPPFSFGVRESCSRFRDATPRYLVCNGCRSGTTLPCLSGGVQIAAFFFWSAGVLLALSRCKPRYLVCNGCRGIAPQKRRQDRRTPYHFPAGSCSRFSACDFRLRGESFSSAATKPYWAAFSRSRIAPQERHTATPCLIFSAQTGQSASGRAS